ncbi:NAD(P)/FAD-dependent oxidoreductase [Aestuariivirga sp.]|uniref:NAD(P)/FAD-dependent oxidoreductase n=1 Tax=Aestuariivirga sp. TaxID=2650926 RepID=UPI0035945C27
MTHAHLPLPKSLYAETARALSPVPELDLAITASVVIVGGGYTGLSTALHMAERGIDAVVLETHEPGWGASGRNGGQVNPGIYPDPEKVIADFGEEMGRRMLAFSSAAPDKVFALVKQHQIDCEAAQTGTLRVAFNAAKLGATRNTFAQLQKTGSPATWMEASDLGAATGTERYLGGIRFPQGGKLNPLGYARGLAEAAQKAGARIFGASPALSIARNGTRWKVTTPRGSVTADSLVLAGNAYTDGLWPNLKQTIVPVYSTIVATAPLSDNVARSVMPSGSVLYEVANNTVYYRLDANNRMLMGGRSLQRDVTRFEDAANLIAYTKRLFPQLADVAWTHVWNGQVAITADYQIHMHEPAENVRVALGYNGRGVAMATAMGSVLADRIAGARREDLPMPVTDLTPIAFHRFHKLGVNIRLVYGKIRDQLGI